MLNDDFFIVVFDVEDCGGAHGVAERDGLFFGADANVSVAEVELLFKEDAFRLSDSADAPDLLISAILNLHRKDLLIDARTRRVKQDAHGLALSGLHNVLQWPRHIDLPDVVPGELGWGIALVGHFNRLVHGHFSVVVVLAEREPHDLRRELEADWVGLRLHEEAEWPIIDVVCDGHVEGFDDLRTEDNIKASFLARWDHLAQWSAVSQLRVLVDH